MDHFERELARLMRAGEEDTPYGTGDRQRLRAGVRSRQRARRAWVVTGSVLTVAGLGIGLTFLAGAVAAGGPTGPRPRPVTSAASAPAPSTAMDDRAPATVRPASTTEGAPMPGRHAAPEPAATSRRPAT
ncbi:hypothetical protein [Kitasatospora paranensis]|uniref:Cellulase n=1 Tax=Kitasatospora paranensis TaxID=258053 RepID=A0ABW2FQC2_9ACTN